jgi:hypothetical protein
MSGDQQVIHAEIKTLVPLVLRGVPKKDTLRGVRGKLTGRSGRDVRVVGTPEDK